MKADNNKLITIEVTIQGIWAASKHMVHQSKKTYKRSREKQKRYFAE
jgi:hypothetical protein